MRTSNVALLAEIDILELRIGIDANELEVVKEFDRMTDEIAELREENNKLKAMIDNGIGWEDMKGGTIQDVS